MKPIALFEAMTVERSRPLSDLHVDVWKKGFVTMVVTPKDSEKGLPFLLDLNMNEVDGLLQLLTEAKEFAQREQI